jgi:RNase adaptor protein for sRNA GlmZ degradation
MIEKMVQNPALRHFPGLTGNLTVTIYSFSYRDMVPEDDSGNGGGFVFDCRSLPNPGRLEEYRHFTGKDQQVIDFLKREPSVDEFLVPVFSLVDQSVIRYLERDFTNLMVCFGCTGGQHRSVYCAEQLAGHLQEKFPVTVRVIHSNLEKLENDFNRI